MNVLWINLFIVFTFSLLARYNGRLSVLGPATLKPNRFYTNVALLSLVLVSGLRSAGIGDTWGYMYYYKIIGTNIDQALTGKDLGFNILVVLLNKISSNPQLLIFVAALITNILVIKVIYDYADPFELGTFLYITSGSFLVSMNGLRQFLASAIIFAAIKWLIDGQWKKYFFLVLLASTLHLSALIMIPAYFIARRKAWSRTTIIMIFLTVTTFVFFKPAITVLFNFMGDNQYSHYRDYLTKPGLGANVIRIIIAAIPLILAFLGRRSLRRFWTYSDYIVNMSLMNFIFTLFAVYNWVIARLTIYFGLFNFLLLPWIIKYIFERESKKLMYLVLVACYLIFFYYENIAFKILYRSDYLPF